MREPGAALSPEITDDAVDVLFVLFATDTTFLDGCVLPLTTSVRCVLYVRRMRLPGEMPAVAAERPIADDVRRFLSTIEPHGTPDPITERLVIIPRHIGRRRLQDQYEAMRAIDAATARAFANDPVIYFSPAAARDAATPRMTRVGAVRSINKIFETFFE